MFFKKKSKANRKQKMDYESFQSYERIQFWLEDRIGNMSRMDPEKLHQRLLIGVEKEKGRIKREGLNPKLCNGLEAYIKMNTYRRMLEETR